MNQTFAQRLSRQPDRLASILAWLRDGLDYAAGIRYFLLTLAVVGASALLVGVLALRTLQSASEATLTARLNQGETAFESFSAERLVDLWPKSIQGSRTP